MSEQCQQETIDFEPDILTVQKIRKAVKWLSAEMAKPVTSVTVVSPELYEALLALDTTEPIDILSAGGEDEKFVETDADAGPSKFGMGGDDPNLHWRFYDPRPLPPV